MKRLAIAVAFLMLSTVAYAGEELPEKPKPRVADKPFVVLATTLELSTVADSYSTAHWIHTCPGCVEFGWFGRGSRSLPKITAESLAFETGVIVGSYLLKRSRIPVLHRLWAAPMLFETGTHAWAVDHNYTTDFTPR